MINKKAIELSFNFIVVIIISIVIFGFGVKFISKLSSEATDLTKMTMEDIDKQISDLICEGSDRVCVAADRKVIKRKEHGFFGIKLMNILEPPLNQNGQEFEITISRPAPSGYSKNNEEIQSDKLIWNPKSRSIFIEKNEEKDIGVGVQVPPDAASGLYIFNVEIKTSINEEFKQYTPLIKLYVTVP